MKKIIPHAVDVNAFMNSSRTLLAESNFNRNNDMTVPRIPNCGNNDVKVINILLGTCKPKSKRLGYMGHFSFTHHAANKHQAKNITAKNATTAIYKLTPQRLCIKVEIKFFLVSTCKLLVASSRFFLSATFKVLLFHQRFANAARLGRLASFAFL